VRCCLLPSPSIQLLIVDVVELQKAPTREDMHTEGGGTPKKINPLSWFGLSKIHGLPLESWDEVPVATFDVKADPNDSQPAERRQTNFCTHHSTLFPTWHRPYVAVFEV
jgi:hypothetical protein